MTGLRDAYHETRERVRGPSCTLGQIRAELPPDELAFLDEILADRSASASRIARALAKIGQPVRPQTVQRHRRGDCACGDAA